MFYLTVLQRVLCDLLRHATRTHGHVSDDVKSVVTRRLQIIDDVTGGVVSDHRLIFFIIHTWNHKHFSPIVSNLDEHLITGVEDKQTYSLQ